MGLHQCNCEQSKLKCTEEWMVFSPKKFHGLILHYSTIENVAGPHATMCLKGKKMGREGAEASKDTPGMKKDETDAKLFGDVGESLGN